MPSLPELRMIDVLSSIVDRVKQSCPATTSGKPLEGNKAILSNRSCCSACQLTPTTSTMVGDGRGLVRPRRLLLWLAPHPPEGSDIDLTAQSYD
jgi:hypothetical protein